MLDKEEAKLRLRQGLEKLRTRAIEPRTYLGDDLVDMHAFTLRMLKEAKLLPIQIGTLVV